MGTLYRTRARLRDIGALAAASLAVGASFGAIAIAYGLPAWVPVVMSVLIFAGGAQFLAVGLLAAGNPIAAVLAGLLLNARHLPFGLAVADTIGTRWRDRLVGSHLMTDEAVAFALAESDPAARRRIYWTVGGSLFVAWNTGVVLGVLLGGATGDPDALGLDAAFPAGLIALILPSLRDRETRRVALTGAALAVLLTPMLPTGLPVMCALLGLLVLFRPTARTHPTPAAPPSPAAAPSSPAVPAAVLPSSAVPAAAAPPSPAPLSALAVPLVPGRPAAVSPASAPAVSASTPTSVTAASASAGSVPAGSADGEVSEGERC
jgi:4-azaleucine resistance transporter AzlC